MLVNYKDYQLNIYSIVCCVKSSFLQEVLFFYFFNKTYIYMPLLNCKMLDMVARALYILH